jgi:hypothetical protein
MEVPCLQQMSGPGTGKQHANRHVQLSRPSSLTRTLLQIKLSELGLEANGPALPLELPLVGRAPGASLQLLLQWLVAPPSKGGPFEEAEAQGAQPAPGPGPAAGQQSAAQQQEQERPQATLAALRGNAGAAGPASAAGLTGPPAPPAGETNPAPLPGLRASASPFSPALTPTDRPASLPCSPVPHRRPEAAKEAAAAAHRRVGSAGQIPHAALAQRRAGSWGIVQRGDAPQVVTASPMEAVEAAASGQGEHSQPFPLQGGAAAGCAAAPGDGDRRPQTPRGNAEPAEASPPSGTRSDGSASRLSGLLFRNWPVSTTPTQAAAPAGLAVPAAVRSPGLEALRPRRSAAAALALAWRTLRPSRRRLEPGAAYEQQEGRQELSGESDSSVGRGTGQLQLLARVDSDGRLELSCPGDSGRQRGAAPTTRDDHGSERDAEGPNSHQDELVAGNNAATPLSGSPMQSSERASPQPPRQWGKGDLAGSTGPAGGSSDWGGASGGAVVSPLLLLSRVARIQRELEEQRRIALVAEAQARELYFRLARARRWHQLACA